MTLELYDKSSTQEAKIRADFCTMAYHLPQHVFVGFFLGGGGGGGGGRGLKNDKLTTPMMHNLLLVSVSLVKIMPDSSDLFERMRDQNCTQSKPG